MHSRQTIPSNTSEEHVNLDVGLKLSQTIRGKGQSIERNDFINLIINKAAQTVLAAMRSDYFLKCIMNA